MEIVNPPDWWRVDLEGPLAFWLYWGALVAVTVVAEALRYAAGADIGAVNAGSVQMHLPAGELSGTLLHEFYPFPNIIAVKKLRLKDVLAITDDPMRIVWSPDPRSLGTEFVTVAMPNYISTPPGPAELFTLENLEPVMSVTDAIEKYFRELGR